jgi:hypothetical protein
MAPLRLATADVLSQSKRLRERALVSAALTQWAHIRCRFKLRLNLSNLLPDKIHHKTCAWREMPSRWIDQIKWKAGSGKVAQHANQRAAAEVVEDFEQTDRRCRIRSERLGAPRARRWREIHRTPGSPRDPPA